MHKAQRLRWALYNVFWSLYGRYAWDDQREPCCISDPPERVVELLQERGAAAGDQVLDAGCGTGNYAIALARVGFRVLGVDFAAGMLARAQVKVRSEPAERVSFRQADLNAPLDFSAGAFDHVISMSVLQAVADPALTLCALHRVLKPGGTLVLSLPRQDADLFTMPLLDLARHRVRQLERRTPGKVLLVILKSLGDRYGGTPRWTAAQARQMASDAFLQRVSLEEGRQILAIATGNYQV